MNNLLTATMTKLSGSAFSTDVGGRIFLSQAPEGCEFPYAVFFIVSDVPEYPGGKTIEDLMFQFSLFSTSESATEITTMLTDLHTILDDCVLTITGYSPIYFIRGNLTTMVEDVTTPIGTSTVKHWAQGYNIMNVKS